MDDGYMNGWNFLAIKLCSFCIRASLLSFDTNINTYNTEIIVTY